MPTNVASMDLRAGPPDPGGFAPDALVSCDYVDKRLGGHSPKFSCSLGEHDDDLTGADELGRGPHRLDVTLAAVHLESSSGPQDRRQGRPEEL